MDEIKLIFKPHADAEKKHSRRFVIASQEGTTDEILKDIYVQRPWANGATSITITISKE